MAVTVCIPTVFRTYTNGEKKVTAAGSTLSEVIQDLGSRYSGLAERLLDGGVLRRYVNVYVGDDDIRLLDGMASVVHDGAVVTILPAVAGG